MKMAEEYPCLFGGMEASRARLYQPDAILFYIDQTLFVE